MIISYDSTRAVTVTKAMEYESYDLRGMNHDDETSLSLRAPYSVTYHVWSESFTRKTKSSTSVSDKCW